MKKCTVHGCERDYKAKGLCHRHYMQMRQRGKILERTVFDPNDFIVEGNICKIGCYNQKNEFTGFALIDLEDKERCEQRKWYIDMNGYPISGTMKLHTFIKGNGLIDHKNRNTLDNRRSNLRFTTVSGNACNSKSRGSKSGYVGVVKIEDKWGIRFRAETTKNGIRSYLGYYKTATEAAIAYNVKSKELHGEFAYQNPILVRRRVK